MKRVMVVVAVLATLGACATPRGEMPYPPRDDELANDGSPAQHEDLQRRYKVRLDRWGVHVGGATRTRGRVEGPFPTEWYPVHPELSGYLSADPETSKTLPNRWIYAAGVGGAFASVILVVAGLGMLGLAGMFVAGFAAGAVPFRLPVLNNFQGTTYQLAGSSLSLAAGLGGAVLATALAAGSAAAGAAILWWADQQFQEAAERFNANIDKRIDANAKTLPPVPQRAEPPSAG